MRLGAGVVVALAAGATAAAQQILEVDLDAGRKLAGGPEYSFNSDNAVVDYGRRLVLVTEAADPLAVTAYSLDDGLVQHVFGGGRAGDGPGELTQVLATAVGPSGVFVLGPGRVLHWSWSGALLHQWRLPLPPDALCALNDRPAVPLQHGGVVFRGDDGGPPTTRIVNGRKVPVHDAIWTRIFVRPARHVSGEPCEPSPAVQSRSRIQFATWPRPTRSWASVSRSRMVTLWSSAVSPSTVTHQGVPASSWRR